MSLNKELKLGKLLTDSQINEMFGDWIDSLTTEELWAYISTWKDVGDICEDMQEWDTDEKRQTLKEFGKIK